MPTSVVLALAVAVAAPAPKDTPKKASLSLVGKWAGKTGLQGGKTALEPGLTLEFTADGKLTVANDFAANARTYAADPTKEPAELDLNLSPGGKGPVSPGIYKVEDDTLTVCFDEGGGARPTKFESPKGSKVRLITLTRVKVTD